MKEQLASVDVVQHKVELLRSLERVIQADQERVRQILHQHVALGHDVLDLLRQCIEE